MFDGNQIRSEAGIRECKPDYEEIAAKLKKRIYSDQQCLDGMLAGINTGSIDLTRYQAVLFYAIIGSLTVSIPKLNQEYENLIKQIEE